MSIKNTVIFLDSDLRQLDWIGVPRVALEASAEEFNLKIESIHLPILGMLKKLNDFKGVDIDKVITLDSACMFTPIFKTIEYSVCVTLEIFPHEINFENILHRREIKKWISIAKTIQKKIQEIIETYKPQSVVYMQGYFLEAALIRMLALDYKFQTIALENTFLPQKIIVEPLTGISVNKNCAQIFYVKNNLKGSNSVANHVENKFKTNFLHKARDHKSPNNLFKWNLLNRKKILFLAQCYTDSSLIYGLDESITPVECICELISASQKINAQIFIKLHPKENFGENPLAKKYNQLTYRKLLESESYKTIQDASVDDLYIDHENLYSTDQLIDDADVIVTINSQSGFESLMKGKEVILLGKSFYSEMGCTWNISHIKQIQTTLNLILNENLKLSKSDRIADFSNQYLEQYCVDKNSKSIMRAISNRFISPSFFQSK